MNEKRYKDLRSPECSDQIPVFSAVGQGLQGDSFKVVVRDPDTESETHLEGMSYDEASKTWSSEWVSENINGGKLSYQYNLRPFTIPQTFTITFIYKRPGRKEWSWTTPAIPYIWSVDEDGNKQDPDATVGSGVATLFIKKTTEDTWHEKLIYPEGTTREDYNAPTAEKPWTVNIAFGIGGDIEVPNIDDIAKITGLTVDQIKQIIAGHTVTVDGLDIANLIDFIKKADNRLSDHIHADLGFCDRDHGDNAFGGQATVKAYIDHRISELGNRITEIDNKLDGLQGKVNNTLQDIVNKIYGGGTIGDDGHITWPNGDKIATGNMNVYGGGTANYIKTDADGENDVQVN